MPDLHVVVLAAGQGTRMRSDVPKVLHRVAGQPLLGRVLAAANSLAPSTITVVVGHAAGQLREYLDSHPAINVVVQQPQLGTAHALLQTEPFLASRTGDVLLLSGDVPLLRAATLSALLETHRQDEAALTVLTATVAQPFGYGRIVRHQGARLVRIAEERDATSQERLIQEINGGVYVCALAPLFETLAAITPDNAQGEYYLPDLVRMYARQDRRLSTFTVADPNELRGVNSRRDLADVMRAVHQQKNDELMAAGVTLIDPATTYIDDDVTVGRDSVLHPGTFLERGTRIGEWCEIHAGSRLVNATLGDGVLVRNHCVITDSSVAAGSSIGPFAHLRPGSVLGKDAHVGNFVELKKTTLGAGSKANHLAYLGDAIIGARANIGAGTITCNYDGSSKHQTLIADEVFVGSNATLVAPLNVERGAYIAAGSAVTEDVPAGSLAIGRARQQNKPEWVAKRKRAKHP